MDQAPVGGVTAETEGRPSVLVVDDHRIFAELLSEALQAAGYEVDLPVANLADALVVFQARRHDIVILDYDLPDGDGIAAVAQLKQIAPRSLVLMLTATAEHAVMTGALEAGCDGFVTKRQGTAAVLAAIEAVTRGDTPVSADMVASLVRPRTTATSPDLTPREVEVLEMLGRGMTNQGMATALHVSVNTVRNHVQHILEKLGAHSKLEAVAIAIRLGLLRPAR